MISLTHASADLPKVVLGDVNLNKFNSPDKMMAHLESFEEGAHSNDSKFQFKLTQITSEKSSNSYTSPVKKQKSCVDESSSSSSVLESQLYFFDQFIDN